MKYGHMDMPDSTASLVGMCLERLELTPFQLDGDAIMFGLKYEDGSEPIFMIRSAVQIGMFRKKPVVAIIAASANQDMSLRKVYLKTFMRAPMHKSDVLFMAELAMHVKTTAWAIAATEDMGECLHFAARPRM